MTGELQALGLKHGTDKATFHGYCDFYQALLPDRRQVDRLLEIGIMDGASLRMWRDWFVNGVVYGCDNDHDRILGARALGCGMILADATQPRDVRERLAPFGRYDVIIDDGSHLTWDQQQAFSLLWDHVLPGGCYVIEDLHTSFISAYVDTPVTTHAWLKGAPSPFGKLPTDASDMVIFEGEPHRPDDFIRRHGFDPAEVRWLGDRDAKSMTAVIRKPAE